MHTAGDSQTWLCHPCSTTPPLLLATVTRLSSREIPCFHLIHLAINLQTSLVAEFLRSSVFPTFQCITCSALSQGRGFLFSSLAGGKWIYSATSLELSLGYGNGFTARVQHFAARCLQIPIASPPLKAGKSKLGCQSLMPKVTEQVRGRGSILLQVPLFTQPFSSPRVSPSS